MVPRGIVTGKAQPSAGQPADNPGHPELPDTVVVCDLYGSRQLFNSRPAASKSTGFALQGTYRAGEPADSGLVHQSLAVEFEEMHVAQGITSENSAFVGTDYHWRQDGIGSIEGQTLGILQVPQP